MPNRQSLLATDVRPARGKDGRRQGGNGERPVWLPGFTSEAQAPTPLGECPLSEALVQGIIATLPTFIEVFLDGNKLFYRPVDSEKAEAAVLVYEQ